MPQQSKLQIQVPEVGAVIQTTGLLHYFHFISSGLTWSAIRSLSRLQILTKASFVSLIVVPILAAVWPAIRHIVNRYDGLTRDASEAAIDARYHVDAAIAELDSSLHFEGSAASALENTIDILNSLSIKIENLINSVGSLSLSEPSFPITWVAVFFASLAVVFGHTFYNLFAPQLVREKTPFEHAASELDNFDKLPTETRVSDAHAFIRHAKWEKITKQIETGIMSRSEEHPNENSQLLKRAIVELGARAEYHSAATSRRIAMICVGCLYLVAIALLFYIIYIQSSSILTEAHLI